MREEWKFAALKTLPVFCGYLFLGIAFGILLENIGFSAIWAFFSSLFIYGGSIQFVMVDFLKGGTSLFTIAVMSLLINSRHIFYGLSFIEKFKSMGKAYPYMIFSLTDETYSLLCSTKVPAGLREERVLFFMAVLDHSYWIFGSVLGALLGQMLPFDSTGIDFAMTALFVVIFIEQWLEAKNHFPALLGFASAAVCLALLGPDSFILPSLILTVAVLILCRGSLERERQVA